MNNRQDRHTEDLRTRFEQSLVMGENCWMDAEEAEDLFQYYLEQNMPERAERVYQAAVSLHPDDEYLPLLGIHLMIEKGEPERALEELDSCKFPDDYYWHYLRLCALADVGIWTEAEGEADMIMAAEEARPFETALDVAHVFLDRECLETGLRFLETAFRYNQDDTEMLFDLAHTLMELHRYAEALTHVERLIDFLPYSAEAWQLKATLLVELERHEEGLDAFDYALAISPDSEPLIMGKIKTLTLMQRDDDALALIAQTEREQPHMQQICYNMRGDILFWQEKYKEAESVYAKGFDKDFFLADSAMRYLECKLQLHKWNAAIALGRQLLRYLPDDITLLEKMADAFYRLDKHTDALRMFRRALRLNPDNVHLLLCYGSLCLDLQNLSEAYRAIHKACRLRPDAAYPNIMMATVCFLKKQYKSMHNYLRRAVVVNPDTLNTFLSVCPAASELLSTPLNL